MDSSNRASPPAPISIPSSSNTSSYERGRTGYFDSIPNKGRSDSYSSEVSSPESPPSSLPKSSHSWVKPSPKVNVYTHCGRHTDQLLFGGPSLSELARAMLRKH